MADLARAAGFSGVKLVPTSGKPGVFGRIDAGARNTVAIYFMYDVKQFVPQEWSSPPLEGGLVQKEGLGTVCMGRGAVNQKGPENSFLGALMAFKAAGKKLAVNLVLVCEGEEEIASPHFGEIVMNPEVVAELKKCIGVFMPEAGQDRDGGVTISLGAKGVVELELVSSGERWGRGPRHDIHSSLEADVDSPSWHLVQALNTLIEKDGHTPAVEGFFEKAKPLTAAQKNDDRGARGQNLGGDGQEDTRGRALGARCAVARGADAARVATDHQYRRPRRRLHRTGRQDGAAAPSGRENRHAPGAGHDRSGHAREAQGGERTTRGCEGARAPPKIECQAGVVQWQNCSFPSC